MLKQRNLHCIEEKFIPKSGGAGVPLNLGANFHDIMEEVRFLPAEEIKRLVPQLKDYVSKSLDQLLVEKEAYEAGRVSRNHDEVRK